MRIAVPTAVIAIGAFAFVALLGNENQRSPLTLDEAVAKLAAAAINAPTDSGGKYLYVKSRETGKKSIGSLLADGRDLGFDFTSEVVRERWIDSDGKGVVISNEGNARFLSDADATAAREIRAADEKQRRAGARVLTPIPPIDQPDGTFTTRKLVCFRPVEESLGEFIRKRTNIDSILKGEDVPDDPMLFGDLVDKIAESKNNYSAKLELWSAIESALRIRSQLTPQQRAVLVKALAKIPNVKVVAGDTDPKGRPAIGIERTHHNIRDTIWFDPETSVAIYSERIDTRDDSVIQRNVIEEQKFVDTMPRVAGQGDDSIYNVVDCG